MIPIKLVYKIHKQIGIFIGIILLFWLVSGIIFTLPFSEIPIRGPKSFSVQQLEKLKPSLVDAANHLKAITGAYHEIKTITLRKIGDIAAYDISTKDNKRYLIDTQTGKHIKITRNQAETIAKENIKNSEEILTSSELSSYTVFYSWGPLPVFQIVFNDTLRTTVYISQEDGSIPVIKNRLINIFSINHAIHDLSIIKPLIKNETVKKALIILFCLTSITGVLSGYYIVLYRRKKNGIRPDNIQK